MGVSVKRVTLWRKEAANRPGVLAGVLGPLADARVDLEVVMGYRYPGDDTRAAIELFPVTGKRPVAAAQGAGLAAAPIPTLLVQGDNRPGLGASLTRAIAEAGINLGFLVAQVVGRKYSAIFGFETEGDAQKATAVIKKASRKK